MANIRLVKSMEIGTYNSTFLLRGLSNADFLSDPQNLQLLKDLNSSIDEIDKAGDLGLTIKFDRIKTLVTSEGKIPEWFGATGEFYIITTALDGTGINIEYKTKYFQGLKRGDLFPLGDGGMLIAYLKNPKWFIDIHMVVMECDSDYRKVGESIEKAKKESKLDELLKFIGSVSSFDPTGISKVITGVDLFTSVLAYFLKENGDDYVATIHDFYLKHQAFGAGLHPSDGTLKRFQNVEASYSIDLTKL
jgi:hypothetical protein